ncbi:MAG: CBS domain-containing protein [Planctomycetota bacterium]
MMEMPDARELLALSNTPASVVPATATLAEIVAAVIHNPASYEVYVIDADGRFAGVITAQRVARFVFSHQSPATESATDMLDMLSAETAGELVRGEAVSVSQTDPLPDVIDVMFRHGLIAVPVVDDDGRILGNLNLLQILAAWKDGRLDHHPGHQPPPADTEADVNTGNPAGDAPGGT